MTAINRIHSCRNCNAAELEDFLAFRDVPLAGSYLRPEEVGYEPLAPLTVAICGACELIQLREVLPDSFYSEYRYVGSGSATYREHLVEVARRLVEHWGMKGRNILEIGCNDGTLLDELRRQGGNRVAGFEPSRHMVEAHTRLELSVVNKMFNRNSAGQVPENSFDLIIFRHVLEHIPDLDDFFAGINNALAQHGLLAIEVPDAAAIINNRLFSHFYHEHLTYFSSSTLARMLAKLGFTIIDQTRVEIHGGSLFVVARRKTTEKISISSQAECNASACRAYSNEITSYFNELSDLVEKELFCGRKIAGYGAAHRTAMVCANAKLDKTKISFVVDQNPHLHGYILPKSHIPILSPSALYEKHPQTVIIFATSFEAEILREHHQFIREGGRFLSLIPKPHLLTHNHTVRT